MNFAIEVVHEKRAENRNVMLVRELIEQILKVHAGSHIPALPKDVDHFAPPTDLRVVAPSPRFCDSVSRKAEKNGRIWHGVFHEARQEFVGVNHRVEGKIIGASKIARDNTGKKKVEEVQRLLLRELQHRVKNTLATVQAMATLTLHGAPADKQAKFIARLHALASAHDVLTEKNWERAPVRDILNRTLEPFQKERIKASGPDVTLDSQKALALTMVLHELATNAVKYGALSNDSGQVRIDWTVGEDHDAAHLKVCWEERDGPLVQAPARKGFGSRLIEASLKNAQVLFAPEGITCTLEVSL